MVTHNSKSPTVLQIFFHFLTTQKETNTLDIKKIINLFYNSEGNR